MSLDAFNYTKGALLYAFLLWSICETVVFTMNW